MALPIARLIRQTPEDLTLHPVKSRSASYRRPASREVMDVDAVVSLSISSLGCRLPRR